MKMRFLFSRTDRLGGRIIRLFTRGRFDHVAVFCPDNKTVYEISFKNHIRTFGIESYQRANSLVLIYKTVELDYETCLAYMRPRAKSRYDWWRTLAYPFRSIFKGGRKHAINCIEFAEGIANAHGFKVVGNINANPDEFLYALRNLRTLELSIAPTTLLDSNTNHDQQD